MKITFFTNEYSHPKLPTIGGLGSFLKTIAHEMDYRNHEVHIVGFHKKKMHFKDGTINVFFFKSYFKKFVVMELIRSLSVSLKMKAFHKMLLNKERKYLASELKRYVKKHTIDIVESHVFNGYSAFWDNSIPLVLRFHGSYCFWYEFLGKKEEPNKIELEKKALLATPYVIAVSKFSAAAINKMYAINLAPKIIYNGIDTTLFSPKERNEIPKSIFYVGALSDAKGLDVLCAVFNDVIKQHPDATLHIIGKGQQYFKNNITKTLSNPAFIATVYYGEKQIYEIPEILNSASICILPSVNETFGLVYLEGMAMKKVVIAADNLVVSEIITSGKNGLIATFHQEYVDYVTELFSNPELKHQIAENARETVLNNFTKEIMTEKSIAYYEEILQNKS